MEIFAVKWNVALEISHVLLNDAFAEFDGSRQWDWEYYDWRIRSWWIASRIERYTANIITVR